MEFNKYQLAVINDWENNIVNIAGPGSGKTATLTAKIKEYLKNGGSANNILVLTFTNAAAQEILHRNQAHIDTNEIYFGTFHSMFYKLINNFGGLDMINYEKHSFYTPNDIIRIFGNILTENFNKYLDQSFKEKILDKYYENKSKKNKTLNKTVVTKKLINIYGILGLMKKYIYKISNEDIKKIEDVKKIYQNILQKVLTDITKEFENIKNMENKESHIIEKWLEEEILLDENFNIDNIINIIIKTFDDFVMLKFKNKIIDFDDILLLTLYILNKYPNVKKRIQNQFEYIFVDEYQDTNFITKEILKNIKGKNNKIIVIGDPYQSIYKFLGATIQNILNSQKDFNAIIKQLPVNYRSNKYIIELINYTLEKMNEKIDGLIPLEKGNDKVKDTKIKYGLRKNIYQQMDYVVRYIRNNPEKKITILHRSGNIGDIENTLIQNGIKYNKLGGQKINESPEIKAILYIYNYLFNPLDIESLNQLLEIIKINTKLKKFADIENLKSKRTKELINELSKLNINNKEEIKNFYEKYIFEILEKNWGKDRTEEAKIRIEYFFEEIKDIENITELKNIIFNYLTDTNKNTYDPNINVTYSTIHSAKGLEWDTVFLIDFTAKQFYRDDKNEAQRLVYVAISRAKEELYIFSSTDYFFNIDIEEIEDIIEDIDNIENKNDENEYYLTFGKYKNKNIKTIDYNYKKWLYKNMNDIKYLTEKQKEYLRNFFS